MRLAALINTMSGSVPVDAHEQFDEFLKDHGWPCQYLSGRETSIADALNCGPDMECDALIVWGGDGTVSSVLQRMGGDGPPVLPLPGGTMNMLHQRVHGAHADWRTCLVEALLRKRPEMLPAAKVDRKLVFVAALAGRLTGLALAREAVREGDFAGLAQTLADQDSLNLESSIQFEFTGSAGAGSGQATALGIFVTENRRQLDNGLDLVTTDPQNLAELTRIGLQALISPLNRTQGVTMYQAQHITLSIPAGSELPGTLDGEPVVFSDKIEVEFIPEAARVLGAGLS